MLQTWLHPSMRPSATGLSLNFLNFTGSSCIQDITTLATGGGVDMNTSTYLYRRLG